MEDEVDVESAASGSSSATESLQNQQHRKLWQNSPNGGKQTLHHRPSSSSTDSAVQTSVESYDNNNEVKQLKQWFQVFVQIQTRDRLYKAIVTFFCFDKITDSPISAFIRITFHCKRVSF